MCDDHGVGELVPHLAGVVIERVEQDAVGVQVWPRAKASSVACPACGGQSARVHSRYDRRVADAALVGRPVVLRLQVRRMLCTTADCPVRTFAEQVPGLTEPYARRSLVLRGMLEKIGWRWPVVPERAWLTNWDYPLAGTLCCVWSAGYPTRRSAR